MSVHSGLVHYVEGQVYLNDKLVEPKFGHFPEVKPQEELRAEDGRAEVLLTPGSFFRIGESSAFRMISNQLSDTQIEVLKGEAVAELVDFTKDKAAAEAKGNSVTILYKGTATKLLKAGIYRFNGDTGQLRVFDGEAVVKSDAGQATVGKGKQVDLSNGALAVSKFDAKSTDELVRWSERRSGYLAAANVSAANALRDGGLSYGSYSNGWTYNPWFGMYTFVPMYGSVFSPFGYGFWSPYTVYNAYMYGPMYGGYGAYGPGLVSSRTNLAPTTTHALMSRGTTGARGGSSPLSGGPSVGGSSVASASSSSRGVSASAASSGGHSMGGGRAGR
jgi:hypothetical protein